MRISDLSSDVCSSDLPTWASRACSSAPSWWAERVRSPLRWGPARRWCWRCRVADRIRIGLCDDHAVVRSGLRRILEAEADFEVVGEAGSAAEAVEVALSAQPDVFVMDLGLPDRNGIAATADVCSVSPGTRVLVLTVHDDVAYLRRAFDAGATGYLVTEAADVDLVQAVPQVPAGRQYVHPSMGAALLAPDQPAARPAAPGGVRHERGAEVLTLNTP